MERLENWRYVIRDLNSLKVAYTLPIVIDPTHVGGRRVVADPREEFGDDQCVKMTAEQFKELGNTRFIVHKQWGQYLHDGLFVWGSDATGDIRVYNAAFEVLRCKPLGSKEWSKGIPYKGMDLMDHYITVPSGSGEIVNFIGWHTPTLKERVVADTVPILPKDQRFKVYIDPNTMFEEYPTEQAKDHYVAKAVKHRSVWDRIDGKFKG